MSSRDIDTRFMELTTNVGVTTQRKPKLLIIGHARHGKDTFAEICADLMDLTFVSSSIFVGERCVWPSWGMERYDTFEECFADRVNFRPTWGDLIAAWNTPDKARTARTMLEEGNDMYVGMRRTVELEACVAEGIFDYIIWVDAHERHQYEGLDSMDLQRNQASIYIDNNGTLEELEEQAVALQTRLSTEGFNVNKQPMLLTKPVPKNVLLSEPKVFIMGQTQMNESALAEWANFNKLTDFLNDSSTPLGRLWQDTSEDDAIARMVEFGGRHCYRAWGKGRDRVDYIANIIEMEHGSVLEHATINWAVQGVSRSLSLELARHRVGIALSQESQRYVDASEINFVIPPILSFLAGSNSSVMSDFHRDCMFALNNYKKLQGGIVERLAVKADQSDVKIDTMATKRANEAARALLPNCTETRFLWTTNMRFLMHFLWLRGGSGADLEIRRLAVELLAGAKKVAPEIFGHMTTQTTDNGYGVPIIVHSDA